MDNNFITTLENAFLDYSAYTIQKRAIPDARDGLKWSARQILHAQWREKLTHDKPIKKAQKSISAATSFSYIHGPSSCYGTLIRMGRPYSYRYMLQDIQGNFGPISNGKESAERYVELRASEIAALLFSSIEKDTIEEWEATYDNEGFFPRVLPSLGFYNIINGSQGIASGMSTSIPQFNLKEVNAAMVKLLWNPNIDFEDIYCVPDFATGAILANPDEVKESLRNGNGKACILRSVIDYEPKENLLRVKEIPYNVLTNTICEEISLLLEEFPGCGIDRIVDGSQLEPDLEIYLTKTANPERVKSFLLEKTSLQTHYTINMMMLENGVKPRLYGWKEALLAHINHEKKVYRKSFEFDLQKNKSRLHIVEGLLIAITRIEEIIQVIKESLNAREARENLQKIFGFSEPQAKSILDIKLARLANLEYMEVQKEKSDLEKRILEIENLLRDEKSLFTIIEKRLKFVADQYGDMRRTKAIAIIKDEEEIKNDERSYVVAVTNYGNIIKEDISLQGGKRKIRIPSSKEGEFLIDTIYCKESEDVIFITSLGNSISYRGKKIPAVLPLKSGEFISYVIPTGKEYDFTSLAIFTKNGVVKGIKIEDTLGRKEALVSLIKLKEEDEIVSVVKTDNESIVSLMTRNGFAYSFRAKEIRDTGKNSEGVLSINLSEEDYVVGAVSNEEGAFSITSDGRVRLHTLSDFPLFKRGAKGRNLSKIEPSKNIFIASFVAKRNKILVFTNKRILEVDTSSIEEYTNKIKGSITFKIKEEEFIQKIFSY